ncbi:MAG TPA: pyridoxamine 5'-phosphate oxidase family protein [Candidatus Aquilonibacter sp.]
MEFEGPRREAARLIAAQVWLALGTVDQSGLPSVTYVPFAAVDGAFGIVVSRLAAHTANLLARRPASVLVVDDDIERRDAFTRARFTIGVTPSPNPAGSAQADAIWTALERRQGETVRVLRTLPDFEAIALEPLSGRLVLGFAAAHDLEALAIGELLRSAD